ncbi:MAG: aminotransferase class IV, partial [Sedimentibacter sp.]
IHTITIKIQRTNPNIKAYTKDFKDTVEKVIDETKSFEAILINDDNTISEGSKSNVFFVKGERLITSLDDEVLLGVTRNKVIEVCKKNDIEVERRVIEFKELNSFDGAFITGTSNDVLPIKTIDDITYNSAENQVIMKVSKLYLKEVMKN